MRETWLRKKRWKFHTFSQNVNQQTLLTKALGRVKCRRPCIMRKTWLDLTFLPFCSLYSWFNEGNFTQIGKSLEAYCAAQNKLWRYSHTERIRRKFILLQPLLQQMWMDYSPSRFLRKVEWMVLIVLIINDLPLIWFQCCSCCSLTKLMYFMCFLCVWYVWENKSLCIRERSSIHIPTMVR